MGFHSVWPWRASEMIALEKNILSTLEPFPSRVRTGEGGGSHGGAGRMQTSQLMLHRCVYNKECDTLQRFQSSSSLITLLFDRSLEPELIVPVQGWKIPWDSADWNSCNNHDGH